MLHLKMVEEDKVEALVGSDFSDIFEDFFGDFGGGKRSSRSRKSSNNRGSDLRYDLSINLGRSIFRKKTKIFNFQLLKNVILVKEMVLSQVSTQQTDVLTVEEMEECVQTKVFLQSNKHVLSVLVVVKK